MEEVYEISNSISGCNCHLNEWTRMVHDCKNRLP